MKFQFEQNTEDLIDLSKHSLSQNKLLKWLMMGFVLFVLLYLGLEFLKGDFSLDALLAWLIPIILIAVLWYVLFKYLLKKRFSASKTNEILVGERTIELSDDEILVITPVSTTSFQWSAISELKQSDRSYFLFLGTASQALIIPKRAMGHVEAATFEIYINDHISD